MENVHPNEFVIQLSENATTRKKRSLEVIYNVCKEQYGRGSKDFSISTIARLSIEANGPSEQTIRNKEGADYRALMHCWANHADGATRKPKVIKENTISDEILRGITDPTIRALVGVILAENRKLKGENSLLKSQTKLTIDMRQITHPLHNNDSDIDAVPKLNNILPSEIDALQHAISDDFLKGQGWSTDAQGRIKYKNIAIYKPGYVTAIKKIISCLQEAK